MKEEHRLYDKLNSIIILLANINDKLRDICENLPNLEMSHFTLKDIIDFNEGD